MIFLSVIEAYICHVENKTIKANIYETVSNRFKVLAYPEIASVVERKSTNHIEDTNWRVEFTKLSEVLWSVELNKVIIQEEDFGNYIVSITSYLGISTNRSFIISLK
ncbi:hypothetical protein Bpfe_026264, partial [Biomphalaria pfeifferi]